MNDPGFRPALADKNAAIDAYNTIFVGFPIWWYVAPTIINTFLETYDFSGKRVILFATSGGSGFGKTAAALKKSLSPDAALVEGKLLNTGLSPADLRAWCQSLAHTKRMVHRQVVLLDLERFHAWHFDADVTQ